MLNKISITTAILLIFTMGTASAFTAQEQLGQVLFSDTNLSTPAGQSCQSCHDPAFAFTEPDKTHGVSGGATAGTFGNRNAPSAAYAALIPEFSFIGGVANGGLFWDGRAANLTEQAKAPFLNPLEMNNTGQGEVLGKIQAAAYAPLFNQVCGASPDQYTCMAAAIAAFENTPQLNRFSSKFDMMVATDPSMLTAQERRGLALFGGKAECVVCHPEPFFTNFNYENIGVPSNLGMMGDTPNLTAYFPFYYPPLAPAFNPNGLNFVDTGLARNPNIPLVQQSVTRGRIKVPTLRNVNLTAPYMHNGVFRTLKEVVHFYNTRDALGNCANNANPQPGVNCWPLPEVPQNLNIVVGNLGLTDVEENDLVAFLNTLTDGYVPQPPPAITSQEQLGSLLFADTNLSTPAGQSCQSCHEPQFAFTDPDKTMGVSKGATPGRFGKRNAPSVAYASNIPDFGLRAGEFIGGMFWDGRAANLTEYAKAPFLNPLEMNNTGPAEVLGKIQNASYASQFNTVCGASPDQYTCMADAIAAFERTPMFNRFNSKFDQNPNLTGLSSQEQRGFRLFNGKAQCFLCHASPFFTDFDYANIGVPSNLGMIRNTTALQAYFPFYYLQTIFNPDGLNFVDQGLAGNINVPLIQRPFVKGMMKAPTLRNVNLTAPYMHNGVFSDLKTVVHFYNTRDTLGNCANNPNPQPGVNCWPAPEVPQNLNKQIGNLGLTDAEENDIVAFLNTLTDNYVPQPPPAITSQEQLGNLLFTDTNLSTPPGQGCISCHDPRFAFTDQDKNQGVSAGATPGRFGNRNAPTILHAATIPDFGLVPVVGTFFGGLFWDGRAANLMEQAKAPFLNPLEMNNTGQAEVLSKIQAAAYAPLFNTVCGTSPDQYACMAAAIAAFEKTPEMNKFNSRLDLNPNMSYLTVQEKRGFALFSGKGKCVICHPAPNFFSDADYENTGLPSNLGMMGNTTALQAYFPFYYPPLAPAFNPAGLNFIDTGLAGNLNVPANLGPGVKGFMKTPTLRNVEVSGPYMHNGVFRDLKRVVHFYNTRDILGNCADIPNPQPGVNCWPVPEVPVNVNVLIGNLGLTDGEENDIVAFLKTLTDVTLNPALDVTAPVINSVTLNTTNPIAGSIISVTVDATDNVAVTNVTANGFSLSSQGGSIWSGSITALNGTNTVNVSASDAAGNIAWNNATSYTTFCQLCTGITGFSAGNGIRGSVITANVNVTNSGASAQTYVIVVSGVSSQGDSLAGTATLMLAAGQSMNDVPVLVSIPPVSPVGGYNLISGIYTLATYPNTLIMARGPVTATVS